MVLLVLTLTLLLVAAVLIYLPLVRNYRTARGIGLSTLILPWSPENPLALLLTPTVMPYVRAVPFLANTGLAHVGQVGWEFKHRSKIHRKLGDCFTIATPGKNWIYVGNAEMVEQIIAAERREQMDRPVELLAMLDVYGQNLSTLQGADWHRMRKCTAAVFNHRCMQLTWSAAIKQASQALSSWEESGTEGVFCTAQDLRTIALDVLLSAAFNVHHDFRPSTAASSRDSMSQRDALATILENAILILAVGPKNLAHFTFPRFMKRLGDAASTFKQYMIDEFEAERGRVAEGEKSQGNLMATLVRACLEEKLLSQQEVFGNIFLYNFTGHDTTAHSSLHTILLLAASPQVQEWVREEIRHVLPLDDPSTWDYSTAFPRLKRTLAVLLETLRLYEPLLSLLKVVTAPQGIHFQSSGQKLFVPCGTRMVLNVNAFQTDERYWGEDGEIWRPSRWIASSSASDMDAERLTEPVSGAYLPWGEGMRACPGKRFSQAEHVGLMVSLLRNHQVAPKLLPGEDGASARQRVLDVANDSGMKLLHQVLHPERAPLVWTRI